MDASAGYPVVLTADRLLMAGYDLLFDGMLAASQTTTSPPALFGRLLMPSARADGVRASRAPLGLRRIEAALLEFGFSPDEVVVVDPQHLAQAIGRSTRIIGISSGEPLGLGMNSSTMTTIAGGRIWPQAMFQQLMHTINKCLAGSGAKPRIVLGGPGAWQMADNLEARNKLGINHVIAGYSEANAPGVFRAILEGEVPPTIIPGGWRPGVRIPPIRGASTMGVIEISRGCGWGCDFCTIGDTPMSHLPEATILADAQTNLAGGLTNIGALSEDLFRFGAEGSQTNPQAVINLLHSLRKLPGLRLIQTDHANIVSVGQYSDGDLILIHHLMVGNDDERLIWINLGVETASGKLLKANGGGPKMQGYKPEEWGELCRAQIIRLARAGFFPLASLMVGLPGETEEDIQQTKQWVQSLQKERLAIFPILYAPINSQAGPERVSRSQWDLIRACYRLNFRRIPRLYWDNQTGGGVPLPKRLLLQVMGRGQIWQWKMLLGWHRWRSRA